MSMEVRNLPQLEAMMAAARTVKSTENAIQKIEGMRAWYMTLGYGRAHASFKTIEALVPEPNEFAERTNNAIAEMRENMVLCLRQGNSYNRAAERSLDALLDAMRNITDQNK